MNQNPRRAGGNRKPRVTLASIERILIHMSAQLDHLKASVASLKTVDESAAALLAGLSQQILAAKDDPVAIEAIAADIDADQAALAAAVAANTPAAPVAPAPPAA